MATLGVAARIAAVNALTPLFNSGSLQFYDANHVLLATCTFAATAFGAANEDGVAQANEIAVSGSAVAGTVSYALAVKSDGLTPIAELTCDDESGTDLVFDTLILNTSDCVFIEAMALGEDGA